MYQALKKKVEPFYQPSLESIQSALKKLESKGFVTIEKVIEKKELFSQTIESVQFGFISLENDLQKISDNFSLSKLKIDYNKKTFLNKNAASVQIKLNFYGSLMDTLSYMNTLEKDNPFIRINNVKAAFDKNLLLPNFELNLTYKYQVSAAQI